MTDWQSIALRLLAAIETHRNALLTTGAQHHDVDEHLWSVLDRFNRTGNP